MSTYSSDLLIAGNLVLSIDSRQLIKNGIAYRLTPKQYALLKIFMTHRGQVLTRKFLMKHVWDTDYVGDTRTLEVHVSWIRKCIEDNPRMPTLLRTIHGVGYCFDWEDE